MGSINSIDRLAEIDVITAAAALSPRDTLMLQNKDGIIEIGVRAAFRANNASVMTNTLLAGHAAGPVQQLLVQDESTDVRTFVGGDKRKR